MVMYIDCVVLKVVLPSNFVAKLIANPHILLLYNQLSWYHSIYAQINQTLSSLRPTQTSAFLIPNSCFMFFPAPYRNII